MLIQIKQLILDSEYEIKFVKSFRGFKNIPIKGFMIPENDTILINKNLSDQEKIITIIHEFIHILEPNWPEHKVEKHCLKLYKNLDEIDHLFFSQLI